MKKGKSEMLFTMLLVAGVTRANPLVISMTTKTNDVTFIIQGCNVMLNCTTTEQDGMKGIKWFKDNNSITDDIVHTKKDAHGFVLFSTVYLQNVNTTDTDGVYQCSAWRENRPNVSTSYHLRVDEAPVVDVDAPYIDEPVGSTAFVTCKATAGWPIPIIQWVKPDGGVIDSTVLFIENLSMNDDQKKYTCIGSNRAGKAETDLIFYITPTKDVIKPLPVNPPEITSAHNRKVTGSLGNAVSFTMRTQYTPGTHTIYNWSRDGQDLQPSNKYNMSSVFFNSNKGVFTLTVNDLNKEDAGKYDFIVQTSTAPKAEDNFILQVEEIVNHHPSTVEYVEIKHHGKNFWLVVLVPISALCLFGIVSVTFLSRMTKSKSYQLQFIKGIKTETPKFDLFISYAGSDSEWVSRKLIPLLDKHHVTYSIHSKDFEIGKTIVDNMADSVYTCRHVIAVLSDRYTESPFCRAELEMAVCRSTLHKKPLLTVINLGCNATKKLRKLSKENIYLQSVQKDKNDGWQDKLMMHLTSSITEIKTV